MHLRRVRRLWGRWWIFIVLFFVAVCLLAVEEAQSRALEAAAEVEIVASPPGLKYRLAPRPELNRYGFRERDVATAKPPGMVRVAAMGDSTTYGMMLRREQAWPGQLETLLDGDKAGTYQVLNFGVPAYDIEQIVALTREVIRDWAPDILVYGCFWNDPSPTLVTRMGAFPTWVGTTPRPFFLFGGLVDGWLRGQSALFRRAEGEIAARYLPDKEETLDWAFFERHANALIAVAAEAHTPLVVLSIPAHILSTDWPDCDARAGQWPRFCDQSREAVDRVDAYFAARNVPVVSGLAAYRQQPARPLFLNPDNPSHPSAEGHARLARAVRDRVALLPATLALSAPPPAPPPAPPSP